MPDLWKMDESRQAGTLSTKLDDAWARRTKDAQDWNLRLTSGDISPGVLKRMKWAIEALLLVRNESVRGMSFSERRRALESQWRNSTGLKEPSLSWALNDVFGWHFWAGGLFKVWVLVQRRENLLIDISGFGRYLADDVSLASEGVPSRSFLTYARILNY